jgi:hypothetical protein
MVQAKWFSEWEVRNAVADDLRDKAEWAGVFVETIEEMSH